jgi:hypothetical protein
MAAGFTCILRFVAKLQGLCIKLHEVDEEVEEVYEELSQADYRRQPRYVLLFKARDNMLQGP